jgi:hypothetical protein
MAALLIGYFTAIAIVCLASRPFLIRSTPQGRDIAEEG